RACSSGRRSVESAPVRAFPPAAAEPAALLVAVSMVSVTKDPSPSFAPASQRAGRGWSTPGRPTGAQVLPRASGTTTSADAGWMAFSRTGGVAARLRWGTLAAGAESVTEG